MEEAPINEVRPMVPTVKKTKTEQDYERAYLFGKNYKFEGITLRMSNGHRYTPDYFVCETSGDGEPGTIELHEVKGSYKLQSYGRAKMAFDQCKIEFPMFKFIWATKTKEGWELR